MEKQAKIAIAAMLNAFPQRAGNPDLLLRTFEDALREIPEGVVCDIARKFTTGQVDGQSLTFAPSIAEFTKAARDLAEVRKARFLAPPTLEVVKTEPIDRRVERVRSTYAGRRLIRDNVSLEEFKLMASRKELPERCEFVGLLGAIYAA